VEDLFGQLYRGGADGALADARFGAHALGEGKSPLEELIEDRPRGVEAARCGERLFDLPCDLRLADDQGVEARDYAEEVADRGLILAGT